MASRLLTFAVWALVAASGLFWGLRLFVQAPGLPAAAQVPATRVAMGGDLGRVLGVTEEPDVAAEEEPDAGNERFQLLGVVAPSGAGASRQGVALIGIDGQPAKAYRTGAVLDGDTVLLAVGKRSAQLGPQGGPASNELTLPDPAPPATGTPGAVMNLNRPMPPAGMPHLISRPMVGGGVPAPQPVPQQGGDNDEED